MAKKKLRQLSDFRTVTFYEFKTLLDYAHVSRGMFEEDRNKLKGEIERLLQVIKRETQIEIKEGHRTPEHEDALVDLSINELYLGANETFQKIMINNSFVASVSMLENLLKKLCGLFADDRKISPDEINAKSYTQKSIIFLSKVVGIYVYEEELIWQKLRQYIEIRNMIVHNNSVAKKISGKKLDGQPNGYKILKQLQWIVIEEETETSAKFSIKNINFIDDFCESAETFLKEISDRAEHHIKQMPDENGMTFS